MFIPIVRHKLDGDFLQLLRQTDVPGRRIKTLCQCRRHRLPVFLLVLPQPGPSFFIAARVGHIENIPQERLAAAVVNDGNTRGTPAHIPAHPLIPEIVLSAGGGVGPLGIDQELLREGVFIEPPRRAEERRPCLMAGGDLPSGMVGQLYIGLELIRHRQEPPSQNPGTAPGRRTPRRSCAPA